MHKPTDPYSPLWPAYWAANPHKCRSVGAAAAGESEGDPGTGDGGAGEGAGEVPAVTAEQLAQMERERQEMQQRLQKLEQNNQALLDEKRQAKEEADRQAQEAARKNGDLETLEQSWQQKVEAEQQKAQQYQQTIQQLTAGQTAQKVAAEVFGPNAELMLPHVQGRLQAEIDDQGRPKVRVLDAQGNPSAMSPEELAREFRESEKFAPFAVASRASGGGPHSGAGGGGAGDQKTMSRADFDGMNPHQQAQFMKNGGKVVDE